MPFFHDTVLGRSWVENAVGEDEARESVRTLEALEAIGAMEAIEAIEAIWVTGFLVSPSPKSAHKVQGVSTSSLTGGGVGSFSRAFFLATYDVGCRNSQLGK